jgi:ankyrin repeat protein
MKKRMLTLVFVVVLSISVYSQAQNDLFSSCLKGDIDGVKNAVESGANVNTPDPISGQNALAYAYFYPEITQYLLEKGCDPNGGSYPALVSASSVGSYDVMKMLLENGADPNKTGATEAPLLKVVQMTNCAECAELLLSNGADKNTTGSNYGNLIGVYASFGQPQSMRKESMRKYGDILKNYGLSVPDWYYNPSETLNAKPEEMLKVLLSYGIDIDTPEKNILNPKAQGATPLFTALNVGIEEIIMSLLNNGANYNVKYDVIEKGITMWSVSDGYTPLMYAAVKKYSNVVKWISSQGDVMNHSVSGQTANSNKVIYNISGLSAIYLAILNEDMESIKALAESNIKWENLTFKALPGQKFEKSYGSIPSTKFYKFGTIGGKKGQKELNFSPSLFAELLELKNIADYLKTKDL